jgi:molybdopterin converting factor small subunit
MSCTVHIPSPLRSYTGGAHKVPADGATLAEVLASLEGRFTGIRFRVVDEQSRIRPHIRFYVNAREAQELSEPVGADETVHVICALTGG